MMAYTAYKHPSEDSDRTAKILVVTFHRRDWATYEEMLARAREKVPDLTIEGVISVVLAEVARCQRENVALPFLLNPPT